MGTTATSSDYSDELDLIDLTIKKFTRPRLAMNLTTLRVREKEIKEEREDLLTHLGVVKGQLTSDARFADLLRAAGCPEDEIPRKFSQKQKKMVYAFSKTDKEFEELGFNIRYALLCKARLMFKSSLEETRIKRLADAVSAYQWKFGRPLLAVPIKYYGAHTGRFSGLDKLNLQNLGRGSKLRVAITTPSEDEVILAGDLSQIEARLVATVAGQWDLVDQFAQGEDVYSLFAEDHYGYPVNKHTHPKERFVGKTGILQLGFQAGAEKFYTTMNDVHKQPIEKKEALQVVNTYRTRYKKIVDMWDTMQNLIVAMARGMSIKVAPIYTKKNAILLPNGMLLRYPDLKKEAGRWTYLGSEGQRVDIYGGKLFENIIQALARIVVTSAELRCARAGLFSALSVHDELVFVVPRDRAEQIRGAVQRVMERRVPWLPELPVAAEVKYGSNYGEVK